MEMSFFPNQKPVWAMTHAAWSNYWSTAQLSYGEFAESFLTSPQIVASFEKLGIQTGKPEYILSGLPWAQENFLVTNGSPLLPEEEPLFVIECPENLGYYKRSRRLAQALKNLKSVPRHLESFNHFLLFQMSLGGRRLTRQVFIDRHLKHIPQFQELLQLEDSELHLIWEIISKFLESATDWLWKRFATLLKQFKRICTFFSQAVCTHRGEDEKLWPLLMAFKNN